jgi:aminoglycoside 3-N-acetyltransferase
MSAQEKELALLRISHLKLAASEENLRIECDKLKSTLLQIETRETKLRDLCRVLQKKAIEAEAEGRRLALEESNARSTNVETMVADVQAKLTLFSADAAKTAAENESIKNINTLLEQRHVSELSLKDLEAKILLAKTDEANARADALTTQNDELKKLLSEAVIREDSIKAKIDTIFNEQEKKYKEGITMLEKEVEVRMKLLIESRERENKIQATCRETEKALVISLTNEKKRLIELTNANKQVAKLTSLCRALQARSSLGPETSSSTTTSSTSSSSSSTVESSTVSIIESSDEMSTLKNESRKTSLEVEEEDITSTSIIGNSKFIKNDTSSDDIDTFTSLFISELISAGVKQNIPLLVHSSLSSMEYVPGGATTIINALLKAMGPNGTLIIPSLSYLFVNDQTPFFDITNTPTNLGSIPETFRRRKDVIRSLHPTHSCCGFGKDAFYILSSHHLDISPVGIHSPFSKMKDFEGQIVFLGCGARCNTSIHGVEESLLIQPSYLLRDEKIIYTIRDVNGKESKVEHVRHDFSHTNQRYERLIDFMIKDGEGYYSTGIVRGAKVHVFDAKQMWKVAFETLTTDPSALTVEAFGNEREWHHLVEIKGKEEKIYKYRVGPPNE